MKTIAGWMLGLVCAVAGVAADEPAKVSEGFEKTPAYFVDRYGPARSSKLVSSQSFLHPRHGALWIKGEFSVRKFRKGDLNVTATFHVPSLSLAGVTYGLGRGWTEEQVMAALSAFGGNWRPEPYIVGRAFRRQDGACAVLIGYDLRVVSPEMAMAAEKAAEAKGAKKKEVPEF